MIQQLTSNERQFALVMLVALAVAGLAIAITGRGDLFGAHGLLILVVALGSIFGVISKYSSPEPSYNRFDYYYDDPSKVGSFSQ